MAGNGRRAGICFRGFLLATLAVSAIVTGQEPPNAFSDRRLTPVDLLDPIAADLQHGSETLSEAESTFRETLRQHVGKDPLSVQKESAYDFMRIRRRVVETAFPNQQRFDLLADMKRYPAAYVGRPVVLYGRIASLRRGSTIGGANLAQLRDLTSDRTLATVDMADLSNAPATLPDNGVPVRVVGFLLKLVGETPYLCTQKPEWLSVESDPDSMAAVRHKTRGIRAEESSAYYETLVRARILPLEQQQTFANALLQARIEQRLERAKQTHAKHLLQADQLRDTDPTKASNLVRAADAAVRAAQQRHDQYLENPGTFPIFADVFLNPELYVGRPVTMRGHVRKVMSYPADVDRFGNTTLHELWLFTDQSQQNPAVIVCPDLPKGFPVDGEVVDGVTVTGYFFKLYRYAADDANRAAPMLLAHSIQWKPQPAQVAGFGTLGTLATVLAIFGGGLLLMYLWSSHEGDRRARETLAMARTADAGMPSGNPASEIRLGSDHLSLAGDTLTKPPVPTPAEDGLGATDELFTGGPPASAVLPTAISADRVATSRQEAADQRPLATQSPEPDSRGKFDTSSFIGASIVRVLQPDSSQSGSRLELSNESVLTLTNDIIEIEPSNRFSSAVADDSFANLTGGTLTQVALDQWDRIYLVVNSDSFVTEDFTETGDRCLVFGDLESLFGEEPDLALRDINTGAVVPNQQP